MPIENAGYISQLVPTQPQGGESISEGDDHLRVIKTAVKQSFPNINAEVTSTPAELNKVGQMASDIAVLQGQVGEAYHGNVASCYYNKAALDAGTAPGGIVYGHNVASVSPHTGDTTKVTFQTPLDGFENSSTAHFAFNITPVAVAGGTGLGDGPIVINVVAATKTFVTFSAFQLDPSDNWVRVDGGKASFSLMVVDMADGQ